jgi:hypothetical protein
VGRRAQHQDGRRAARFSWTRTSRGLSRVPFVRDEGEGPRLHVALQRSIDAVIASARMSFTSTDYVSGVVRSLRQRLPLAAAIVRRITPGIVPRSAVADRLEAPTLAAVVRRQTLCLPLGNLRAMVRGPHAQRRFWSSRAVAPLQRDEAVNRTGCARPASWVGRLDPKKDPLTVLPP